MHHLFPRLKVMQEKIKTAIIGCGYMGNLHGTKMLQSTMAELSAIVDTSCDKSYIKENFSNIPFYDSVDKLLKNQSIDATIVATPTSKHFDIVRKLIASSKHILCEKPLTSTLDEAFAIRDLLIDNDLVVQVGHIERFHEIWNQRSKYPEFFKKPSTIKINRMSPYKGRSTDIDVVKDLMIHDLDLIFYLFNEIPCDVHAVGHKIRTGSWDYVTSKFSFNSGREAFITAGRNHICEVRSLEITNEHGCFFMDILNKQLSIADAITKNKDKFITRINYKEEDLLLKEQEHFFNSINEKLPAIVNIEDGILALELSALVLKSLEKKSQIIIKRI